MHNKQHSFAWSLAWVMALGLVLLTQSAEAQVLYENGPINGEVYAWPINFDHFVSDTFNVSGGISTVTGLSFGAWLYPGDTLKSVEVSVSSGINGGTTYFDHVVVFSGSGCFTNQYGYNICAETGNFPGPTLPNGTYWLNLQNALTAQGDPIYWDENSGVGCHSPGCPSEAWESEDGPVPSESFSVLGSASGTTPEPSSIVLFGSGIIGLAGILRRSCCNPLLKSS